mgnify:FL=1
MHGTRYCLKIEDLSSPNLDQDPLDPHIHAKLDMLCTFELPKTSVYNPYRIRPLTVNNFENTSIVIINDPGVPDLSFLLYSPCALSSMHGLGEQEASRRPTEKVRLTPFLSISKYRGARHSLCSYAGRVVWVKEDLVEGVSRESLQIMDYLA